MSDFTIDTLAILGVGLIGGSLARALKQAGVVRRVIGYGHRVESLVKAKTLQVIDDYDSDLGKAVMGADVIVIATPLGCYESIFKGIAPALKSGAVVTDVGSVKGSVAESAARLLSDPARFVPGHPIAGTEQSGVEASFAELFQAHRVILTPNPETNISALSLITAMWEATGAEVVQMSVAHHDQVLAATSHLPHTLAYALVDCLAAMDDSREIFQNAAGGFADFTRIASSSPEMWHDICYANRESLLAVLERFETHVDLIRQAILRNDSEALLSIFRRAKAGRDEFSDQRLLRSQK